MTNEEAKEIFLNRGYVNGLFDGDKWRQSIVVISKWLEQEPCEDAISRQAVLEIIRDFEYKNSHEEMLINSRIKQLQSVTPAEKVGQWIMHIDDLFPVESTMECDQCHEHQPITIDDNYCPNCGAKMQEEKE